MLPYGKHEIVAEDVEAVVEALRSDRITQGSRVDSFERALCEQFGCDHAVVVNTGTMALELAYRALGVGTGDRVITSTNTFAATANAVVACGGTPVLADIDDSTLNLSPETIRAALDRIDTPGRVQGVAPVHFAGNPCDMEGIRKLARRHDWFVLEDACHAPGGSRTDSEGNRYTIGSSAFSDATVLSFHPVKHFTSGEGGAVLTNRDSLADRVRRLRTHGIRRTGTKNSDPPWFYRVEELGHNGRITDFQCALGERQLSRFPDYLRRRREIAARYNRAFRELPDLTLQTIPPEAEHAYHLFVVQCASRRSLYDYLVERDIGPQVHYIPVHYHPLYREEFGYRKGDFPKAETYYRETLSLPLYPGLGEQDVEYVIETVCEYFTQRKG